MIVDFDFPLLISFSLYTFFFIAVGFSLRFFCLCVPYLMRASYWVFEGVWLVDGVLGFQIGFLIFMLSLVSIIRSSVLKLLHFILVLLLIIHLLYVYRLKIVVNDGVGSPSICGEPVWIG